MSDQPPDNRNKANSNQSNRDRANVTGLLIVILLIAGTVFLLLELKRGIAVETCRARGMHNCEPAAPPPE